MYIQNYTIFKLLGYIFKYIFTYIYIYVIKLKQIQTFFFVNSIVTLTAFAATFGQIDTSLYYAAPEHGGSGTLF